MLATNLVLLSLESIDELGEKIVEYHEECLQLMAVSNTKKLREVRREIKNCLRKQKDWTRAIRNSLITYSYDET